MGKATAEVGRTLGLRAVVAAAFSACTLAGCSWGYVVPRAISDRYSPSSCSPAAPKAACDQFLAALQHGPTKVTESEREPLARMLQARGTEIVPSLLPLLWYREPAAVLAARRMGVSGLIANSGSAAEALAWAVTDPPLVKAAEQVIETGAYDTPLRDYAQSTGGRELQTLVALFRSRPEVLESVLTIRWDAILTNANFLSTQSWRYAVEFARALGELNSERGEALLVDDLLQKRSWHLAFVAARALNRRTALTPAAREALTDVGRTHWHVSVRQAALGQPANGWSLENSVGDHKVCRIPVDDGIVDVDHIKYRLRPLAAALRDHTFRGTYFVAGSRADPNSQPLPQWAAIAVATMDFEGSEGRLPFEGDQRGMLLKRSDGEVWVFRYDGSLRSEVIQLRRLPDGWHASVFAELPVTAVQYAELAEKGQVVVGLGHAFATLNDRGEVAPICLPTGVGTGQAAQ